MHIIFTTVDGRNPAPSRRKPLVVEIPGKSTAASPEKITHPNGKGNYRI